MDVKCWRKWATESVTEHIWSKASPAVSFLSLLITGHKSLAKNAQERRHIREKTEQLLRNKAIIEERVATLWWSLWWSRRLSLWCILKRVPQSFGMRFGSKNWRRFKSAIQFVIPKCTLNFSLSFTCTEFSIELLACHLLEVLNDKRP